MWVSKLRNMNELNKTLKAGAVSLGLCQKWQNEWAGNKSPGELIEMYKRGIDFCIDREWPSCDWILANFDQAELRDKGVFIKENLDEIILNDGVSVIRGFEGDVVVPKNTVVTLHCQSNKLLVVKVRKGARLFMHTHKTPCVVIADEPMSFAKVYRYDDVSTVEVRGNASVKDAFEK